MGRYGGRCKGGKDTLSDERVTGVGVRPDVVIDLRDPVAPRRIDVTPATRGPETVDDGHSRRVALLLLIALNALNVLDAVLTHALTRSGIAREGNPVVEWMTLPGKVAFVGVLSLLLWRLRPRALVVPVVAYGILICYTVAGAALSA